MDQVEQRAASEKQDLDSVLLRFVGGTLEVRGLEHASNCIEDLKWDPRAGCFRAPASAYASVVLALRDEQLRYADDARAYDVLSGGAQGLPQARDYQEGAIAAWEENGRRGVVVLPTGSGKTLVAMLAISRAKRGTLVLAPTLELVRQWHGLLSRHFEGPIGVLGGGEHRPEALTVSTYDSAYLHMEHLGNRFGFMIFDECHHLPSESYALAAQSCIAPFRLGLTATPERADGLDASYGELVGPIIYRKEIVELSGDYLAEYRTVRLEVELSAEEQQAYETARKTYRAFIMSQGIRLGSPNGFGRFLAASGRSREGRAALEAFFEQRNIAFRAPSKMEELGKLIHSHRRDRVIVFTQDNDTAYLISRRFLVPIITHQTKTAERAEILGGLAEGRYQAVVTSKVLNEGVDVPSANVAIVVSGSGSVREHVQRLGRVLRKAKDKRAVLYEIVTAKTTETQTSERRREHLAYR